MFKTHRADWYFIIPASLVWMAALTVTATDFWRQWRTGCHFGLLNLLGLSLMVGGVAVRLVARRALRGQFSSALRILDNHELVRGGIYRHIRHPGYAGDLLFHFALTMLLSSLRGFLVMLLLIPCFVYRMGLEEGMLLDRFGEEYRQYMARTKRLIPFIY
ncbi:MAG: isoprenylcysteine carboxylmethyltransferase family protein [Chloroflexi bacterium]|nr:isoprenylcysteine carboxylmethyltransferase family protein [Chloroflexota bacterium]